MWTGNADGGNSVSETPKATRPLPFHPQTSVESDASYGSIEARVRPFLERLVLDFGFRRSLLTSDPAGRARAVRSAGFDLVTGEIDALLERFAAPPDVPARLLTDDELGAVAGGYEDLSFAFRAGRTKPAGGGGRPGDD
jgi:hypothetical protein